MRRQIQALAAAAAVALAPVFAAESGAQEVGVVVQAEGRVTGAPAGGSPAPLAVPDPVLLDMRVATGRASYARMTFGSAGVLELGAGAELVLDRSTVDAATGAEDSLLAVIAGKVRLALSSLFRGSVEVDTPTATIGVKGTIFTTAVEPDLTVVWVEEGAVEVTSKAGGTVTVTAGYSTTVRRGAAPTAPAPFDPATGAAAVRALPPEVVAPNEEAEPPDLRPRDPQLPGGCCDRPPASGLRPDDPAPAGSAPG